MRRRVLVLAALIASCVTVLDSPGDGDGSRGVDQGGAEAFVVFRGIAERGQVPSRTLLDSGEFFARHELALPSCTDAVCAHSAIAAARRFDGSPWIEAFVGVRAPPSAANRELTRVVLVLENGERARELIEVLEEGVLAFARGLDPGDVVDVVSAGAESAHRVSGVAPDDPVLARIARTIATEPPSRTVALYEAMVTAARAIAQHTGPRRIVLVTSGRADGGLAAEERVVRLGRALARQGVAIDVLGIGSSFRRALAVELAARASARWSHAADAPSAIDSLGRLGAEGRALVARDVVVRVRSGAPLGRSDGAAVIEVEGGLELRAPVLFEGARIDLFVELAADASVELEYVTASGVSMRSTIALTASRGFEPPWSGTAFMTLDAYLGLEALVSYYGAGDCERALGASDALQPTFDAWYQRFRDDAIDEDGSLLRTLRENVGATCVSDGPLVPTGPASFRAADLR